jgi:hypothetical protein
VGSSRRHTTAAAVLFLPGCQLPGNPPACCIHTHAPAGMTTCLKPALPAVECVQAVEVATASPTNEAGQLAAPTHRRLATLVSRHASYPFHASAMPTAPTASHIF